MTPCMKMRIIFSFLNEINIFESKYIYLLYNIKNLFIHFFLYLNKKLDM